MKRLATCLCTSLIVSGYAIQISFAENHSESTLASSPFTLTLNNDTLNCSLIASKEGNSEVTIPLLLEAPCYWVSHEKSPELLQFSYPDENAEIMMLVAGTFLDWTDEKKSHQKLPTQEVCSQYLQGVIINNNEVFAVDDKVDAPHCKGLAIDEKVFRQAAETKNRYQNTSSDLNNPKPEQKNPVTPAAEKNTQNQEDASFIKSIQKTIKRIFSTEE